MLRTVYFAIWCIIFTVSTSANALPQRCNGVVRQRPCDASDFSTTTVLTKRGIIKRLSSHGEVTDVTLKKDRDGKHGIWRGFVNGNGLLRLVLRISRTANENLTWNLGQLEVTPDDGPVRFTFKAPLPEGDVWNWEVLAKPLT